MGFLCQFTLWFTTNYKLKNGFINCVKKYLFLFLFLCLTPNKYFTKRYFFIHTFQEDSKFTQCSAAAKISQFSLELLSHLPLFFPRLDEVQIHRSVPPLRSTVHSSPDASLSPGAKTSTVTCRTNTPSGVIYWPSKMILHFCRIDVK